MINTFNGFVLLMAVGLGLIIFYVGRAEGYQQGHTDGINFANEENRKRQFRSLAEMRVNPEDDYIDCMWK